MTHHYWSSELNGREIYTSLRGTQLLSNPLLNKGTAFQQEERDALGLNGLLPPHIVTREEQVSRLYLAYSQQSSDLQKHIFLRALQDRNEVLFYSLLATHVAEMMPIIYTPTVAQGCEEFSHIYTRPRGLFLSYPLRDRMVEILDSRAFEEVDVIVVTDGERILGIGDQGVGGMGIPIGKLSLYSLLGGIHPSRTLPILLDVGTNNAALRSDPFYLGWKHARIDEAEYSDFIETFVQAVMESLPNVLLQWEDFARPHARPILDRYADQLCTFNDDIQGTAAVVLGAAYAAVASNKQKMRDQKIVIVGAGGAGIGIAEYLMTAMKEDGLTESEACRRFYMVDAAGLLHDGMPDLLPQQKRFAQPRQSLQSWQTHGNQSWSLLDVMSEANATILIGVSTQPGLFNEAVVKEMARHTERPVIFPLSNPTSHAEGIPREILEWTDGHAMVATGAPFGPVTLRGKQIAIAQVNNFYIFPGVGLGVAASHARRVTNGMMLAAARALGNCSPAIHTPGAELLPSIEEMKEAVMPIALSVAMRAIESGLAPKATEEEMKKKIEERFWRPEYPRVHAALV